jgi:hypothetical protein
MHEICACKNIFPSAAMAVMLMGLSAQTEAQVYQSPAAQPQSYVLIQAPPSYPVESQPPMNTQPLVASQPFADPQPSRDVQPSGVYQAPDNSPSSIGAQPPPDHLAGSPPQANNKAPVDKSLATTPGLDLGLQGSYYQYQEPSFGPRLEGVKAGFTARATGIFVQKYFLTGDFRYAIGPSNYKGSGTAGDKVEDLFDMRALAGRDFKSDNFGLSPFIGIGFRYLQSDDRGTTTTGASGYLRQNALLYLPLGFTPRIRIDSDTRLSSTLEGDVVVGGTQTSHLSDVNPNFPNITNHQNAGYGLRGDIMLETHSWSLGPFITYWNINQSDMVCKPIRGSALALCGTEPQNTTIEAGFQFRYHFF